MKALKPIFIIASALLFISSISTPSNAQQQTVTFQPAKPAPGDTLYFIAQSGLITICIGRSVITLQSAN